MGFTANIRNLATGLALIGLLFASAPLCDFGICHDQSQAKSAIPTEVAAPCHGPGVESKPVPQERHDSDCSHCSWSLAVHSGADYLVVQVAGFGENLTDTIIQSAFLNVELPGTIQLAATVGIDPSGHFLSASDYNLPLKRSPSFFSKNAVWRI